MNIKETIECQDYISNNEDSRRSISGIVVKMSTGAISWASRLQPFVTLSTTEAEYIAAVSAGQEILWLRNLFSLMHHPLCIWTTSLPCLWQRIQSIMGT